MPALWLILGCAPVEGGQGAADAAPADRGQVGPATVEGLMEADRAFNRATTERGLDGWLSCFAEDAVRLDLRGEVVRGLAAIREKDSAMFADPLFRLTWMPTDAGLYRDGEHGFTRGRYRVIRQDGEDPVVISQGTYLSIWRRQSGEWKVILDTGVADPTGEVTVEAGDEASGTGGAD
jgi:ketosteroid isomerase-like protein